MRKGLLLAVAIVLVSNAATLALVWHNRSGVADSTMALTERELRVAPRGAEETAVMLWLAWRSPRDLGAVRDGYPWLDRARLEALGFDCHVPPDDPDAAQYYRSPRVIARDAFAVLEYRPDEVPTLEDVQAAWASAPGTSRVAAAQPLDAAGLARLPRLVPVDAGLDAGTLRARYPDRTRFMITTAIVRLLYLDREATGGAPRLTGDLGALLPQQIAVPREQAALLVSLDPGGQDDQPLRRLTHDPRYRVTLRYGRNLEPWVVRVDRVP